MHFVDPGAAQRVTDLRVSEALEQAEARALSCQIPAGRQDPLSRRLRWLLHELGYLLVTVGSRLERHALEQRALGG